ncbi:hypothetical protein R6Q57_018429 [Mikania cordata]
MVYFFASTAQCMQLLIDRRIMECTSVCSACSFGGIHVWHMPAITEIFGDDSVLQFGGGTLGHPWGNAPGAIANRVALKACVQARNEGRDLATEGNEIIREAAKWNPELATACEVWKEIKFEFQAMDTLDTDKDKDKKR